MLHPAHGIREIIPILKEALAKFILGCHQLTTWVFITSITNELILELEILHTHDVSVDLECYML
jgi:hypothetical protein